MSNGTVKMFLCVGNAGTGKTSKINDVLGSINNSDVFLTTPNRTASNRLLGNVRNVNRLLKVRVNFNSYSSNKSSNIIIDEFGEMAKITFESLLTHINNQKKLGQDVNIYCYGDSHQLPSINKLGALDAIWLENEQIFTGDVKEFDGWMDQLYSNLEDGTLLNVVDDWKNYIDSIQVKVLRKNYRMEASGWNATDFNEDFFQELRDKHSFNSNYQLYLDQCLKEGWMIVSPIYDRLKEANKKLSDIGVSDVEEFPFVSPKEHRSEVYLNPYNTKLKQLRKRIPDIPTIEKEKVNQEKWDFMCGCVVANVQGMEFDKICFYMGDSPISVMSHDVYIVNNFHTGLTRGKKDWMYLGNLTDFDKMLNTPRRDVWEQLELNNNNRALEEVVKNATKEYFGDPNINPYSDYKEITNKWNIKKGVWSESTFAIELKKKIKKDKSDIPLYLDWATNITDESKQVGNSLGGKNKTGRGKNQKKFLALTPKQQKQFKADKSNRKVSKAEFKDRWGMTKDQARTCLK
ncbi:AAA family ATPase [Pediococcus pentosaceus]|uniref:AAA family ATPase n=1 Tax=Pediococcus pentosaceus TaxID=1255 RepID=UPI00397D0C89